VLRTPLGLTLNEHDTEGEETQIHVVGVLDGQTIGTVSLKPLDNGSMKLRQMAVSARAQGMRVGAQLVRRAEEESRARGFTRIECHARISALPFYEKLGYITEGESFIEMTLPHIQMHKTL
jgi:predicted N-acetyltransferase YhbS